MLILYSVLSSTYFCKTSGSLFNFVLSISEEAGSWNFGFTPPIGEGSGTSIGGLPRGAGGGSRAGGDSISDPWTSSEGWLPWGRTGRKGHLGCTGGVVLCRGLHVFSGRGSICLLATLLNVVCQLLWKALYCLLHSHHCMQNTLCIFFNISSSFVVLCDAKSNLATSRINPVCTSGLAFCFFFFYFTSMFISMVDQAWRFLEVFGVGCDDRVTSVSSFGSPCGVSGMSSNPARKSFSRSSITFLGPVSAWLEDDCNCALHNRSLLCLC